jgi:hypothetical protein
MGRTRIASASPQCSRDDLLDAVEDRCNRAVTIVKAAARAIEGDDFGLYRALKAGPSAKAVA